MANTIINVINKIWKSLLILEGYGFKCRVCGKLSVHHIAQRGDWYICDMCAEKEYEDETS